MLEMIETSTHEAVYRDRRDDLGVTFLVAIHSTKLGPAFGGARMWRYDDEDQALRDALRLSEGMTYKNAMAELGVGGGKSVIWVREPDKAPREAIFAAFGDVLEQLGGQYITAEDVGTSVGDMQIVRRQTRYVAGLPQADGRAGGDPSPWTALGVFEAIEAALATRGRGLVGTLVGVQGCGAVGGRLCDLLAEAGASLVVADVWQAHAAKVAATHGARISDPATILEEPVDVLAPCALGAVLNADTIPRLHASFVVGAANNQLATPEDGDRLAARGVLYVPDYVANAGGIISVLEEYRGQSSALLEARVRVIGPRVRDLLRAADRLSAPPFRLAQTMVDDILAGPVKASA